MCRLGCILYTILPRTGANFCYGWYSIWEAHKSRVVGRHVQEHGSLAPPAWVSARVVCTDWVVCAGQPTWTAASLHVYLLLYSHTRGALSLVLRRK